MFLSYDGIVFDMLFLDGWQMEADKSSDDVDFLRWHHIIDVTCVMNPAATAAFKFPPADVFSNQINKKRGEEALNRMTAKVQGAKLKSGQVPGEDKRKSKLKSVQPTSPSDLFRIFVEGILGKFFGKQVLPSGKVVSPSAPVPSGLGVSSNYGYWDKVTESIQFAAKMAGLPGSSYITPHGGPVSNDSADVSPANAQGTSIGGTILEGIIGKRAKRGLDSAVNNPSGAAAAIGIGIGGSVAGAVAAGVAGAQGWWADVQKQLTDLGNALGIGADDIFGGGRQPINPQFPTPPQKRRLNDPPPGSPGGVGSEGWSVPATFQELQNRLNRSRRTLAIWLNTGPNGAPEYMLVSPYAGMTTDALSGPTCRFGHIPAIHGNVTGILKLRFETWVAPPPAIVTASELIKGTVGLTANRLHTPNFGQSQPFSTATPPAALLAGGAVGVLPNPSAPVGIPFLAGGLAGAAQPNQPNPGAIGVNPGAVGSIRLPSTGHSIVAGQTFLLTPPITSNRWTMRQVPDPTTHLNTTIIEGTAHFRMDVLQALQLTPDQLRPFFMHPIPFGYVRMPPDVTVLSDGASVQYTVVDIQQMMNNPGGQRWGVHSVKAQQTMSYNSPIDYVRAPFAVGPALDDVAKLGRAVGRGVFGV